MSKKNTEKMVEKIACEARKASGILSDLKEQKINAALKHMVTLLGTKSSKIKTENKKDLIAGEKKGLSSAMIDRLRITDKTIASMQEGLTQLTKLKNNIGDTFDERIRPNGLKIYKIKVPIGVVGIIYESRPNVTVDAAAICLKSHNAVILRGGSEAFHSNTILVTLFSEALKKAGLPEQSVTLIPTTDRAAIKHLLIQQEYVDLIIPRGGEGLIRAVVRDSHIPVIKHYKGVCHIFVSKRADMDLAIPIIVNAKTQRPGVCNAMETLLIDNGLSKTKKTAILTALKDAGVEMYGDDGCRALVKGIKKARKSDWDAEYLDFRLAVRTVEGVREAISHINTYGSKHTDAILSTSSAEIRAFSSLVDTSSVIINASTRFSDGGEYGMGCEIGISTDKLHSRGPMGIEDLTTYKWIVEGTGQIRE